MTALAPDPGRLPARLNLAGLWALVPAAFLYLFYRSPQTVIALMLRQFLPAGWYEAARNFLHAALPIPGTVIGILPGALWVFAVTCVLRNVRLSFSRLSVPLWPLPLIVTLAFEAEQVMGAFTGSFDTGDIIAGIVASGLAMMWPRRTPALVEWSDLTPRARLGSVSLFLALGLAWVWP